MVSPSQADLPLAPGEKRCSVCLKTMPEIMLVRHERHCQNKFSRCPECSALVSEEMKAKHPLIYHRPLMCECGVQMTQLALHHHQRVECIKRLTACSHWWCNMKVPLDSLQQHEDRCGLTPHECPECKTDVQVRTLEKHLTMVHMIDTSTIDWTKPLKVQTLKKLDVQPSVVQDMQQPDIEHAAVAAHHTGDEREEECCECRCGARFSSEEAMLAHMVMSKCNITVTQCTVFVTGRTTYSCTVFC